MLLRNLQVEPTQVLILLAVPIICAKKTIGKQDKCDPDDVGHGAIVTTQLQNPAAARRQLTMLQISTSLVVTLQLRPLRSTDRACVEPR